MHGNVWEMCYDWYAPYQGEQATDPTGPDEGLFHVIRGGSWKNAAFLCRSAYRSSAADEDTRANLGFRAVLAPEIEGRHE